MDNFIPISKPSISQIEIDYVEDAVKSTWVSSIGEYINQFETRFAEICQTKHAVSVFNGTVAIHLALVALGIGQGDEVIMPDLSFIATANAVLHAGATPVFADIERGSLCLDPNDIEQKITPRTKAILPVHLYGHPANMKPIMELAAKYNLLVIEDAAEAHCAKAYNQIVGSIGICGTFSFYGNKIITTGEGGMITTNDSNLNEKLRHLRDHAMLKEKRYWHDMLGYNYRMTNLQAALGCAQLDRIEELVDSRKAVLHGYQHHLSNIPNISLNKHMPWAQPVCWLVCMELENGNEQSRDKLMFNLKENGIDSRPYFFPMSKMPYIQQQITNRVSEHKSAIGLNLPTYIGLSENEVEYICSVIKNLI